jgi:hypothetical protein
MIGGQFCVGCCQWTASGSPRWKYFSPESALLSYIAGHEGRQRANCGWSRLPFHSHSGAIFNSITSTEIIQVLLNRSMALALVAMTLMAAQPSCADDTSGAPARVMPATGTAQPAMALLPGPVERTCAPWDGQGLEFAAKAEKS